ncbi:hypothetical protein GQX74_006102 [Glossina fuscipes]|nr:hypothetical protein GQX74_006102 [Glossina fuscipes]
MGTDHNNYNNNKLMLTTFIADLHWLFDIITYIYYEFLKRSVHLMSRSRLSLCINYERYREPNCDKLLLCSPENQLQHDDCNKY